MPLEFQSLMHAFICLLNFSSLGHFQSIPVIWSHYRPFDGGIKAPSVVPRVLTGLWPQCTSTFHSRNLSTVANEGAFLPNNQIHIKLRNYFCTEV